MAETNFQIKIGVETQLATLKAMEAELGKNIVRLRTLGDVGTDSLKKLERELSQVQAGLGQVGGLGKFNAALGDSLKSLPVVGNLMQGMSGRGAAVGVAVGLAAGAIQQFNAALATADRLQDTSEQLGITSGSLQVLQAHFGDAGIKGDQVAAMLLKLRQSLDSAAAGSEPLRAAFDAMGLSFDELRRLAPDQQLTAVGAALARLPGDAGRSAAAVQILGEQATRANGALRGLGTEGLASVTAFQTAQGQVLDTELNARLAEASQRLERFTNRWTILRGQVAAGLLSLVPGSGAADPAEFKPRNALEAMAYESQKQLEAKHAAERAEREKKAADDRALAAQVAKGPLRDTSIEAGVASYAKTLQLNLDLSAAKAEQYRHGMAAVAAAQREATETQKKAAAEAASEARKAAQLALTDRLAAGSAALARLESEPMLLNATRDAEKLRILTAQRDAVAERLELLRREADSPEGRAEQRGLGQEQAGLNGQISGLQPRSAGDGAQAGLVQYLNSIPDMAQRAQQSVMGIAQAMEQGIGNALTGLINGTMRWSQALASIGSSIVNAIIQAFVRMAAQWIVQQLVMALFGNAIRAAQLAAMAPVAAAAALMWSPAATAASIATFGGAAITGAAMAKTAILASAVGFAEGGPVMGAGTGTSDSIPAWLSNGEYVMPASVVSQYGQGFFDDLRSGRAGIADTPQATGGGSAGRGGSLSVVVTGSANEQRRYLESAEGERVVIDLASRQRLSLGIGG